MKSEIRLKIENLLSSANLRRTRPRMAILNALLQAHKPLTQDQIAANLAPAMPDKVTIYRVLERFCTVGLVHKAFTHKRTVHFELADRCSDIQCHPHFTCNNCGITNCLDELTVPIIKGLKKGFVIHRQQVQLEGLCPRCVKNGS